MQPGRNPARRPATERGTELGSAAGAADPGRASTVDASRDRRVVRLVVRSVEFAALGKRYVTNLLRDVNLFGT